MEPDPPMKSAISENGNRIGSKSGTILNEANYQTVHKDWRKHYVVLHEQNQSKCTNMSRAACRSTTEESENKN